MGLLSSLFWFFTPYTDPTERAIGHFFKRLTEHSDRARTQTRLAALLQRDIAVINLWSEYRYKGYKYLRKAERKKLYANTQRIAEDFHRFYEQNGRSAESVLAAASRLQPAVRLEPQRAVLLQALMDYFSPQRGVYEYRESSSFGRLLCDPAHEKLIGDCNQIVTLYIYLYSRYFEVGDLQLRVLPGHVALYSGGIDIETTSGTFANYDAKEGGSLLPVEEIVSINLLDTTDAYLATHQVAAKDLLQASRFAFILSHNREIVAHNLKAAYNALVNSLMQQNNFKQALTFALASQDSTLIGIVGHNGAVHEMNRHNYAAARRFAQRAPKRDELVRNAWHNEGIHQYQAHRYQAAIKAFTHLNDPKLISQCYEALFFEAQKKLGSQLTTASIKQHASTIRNMHRYAKKSGNKKLIEYTNSLLKHL